MMVYNDISTDARVMRAARALAEDYEVYLYAIGRCDDDNIKSISVNGCTSIGGVKNNLKFVLGAVKTCLSIKPDIVYGHDIFSAVPLVILMSRLKESKFIYDAHELFMADGKKRLGIDEKIQYWFEACAIKKSDLVICAHEKRSEIMKKYHKLAVLPTVVKNISYLPESDSEWFRSQYADFFKKNTFKVVYAGGLLPGRRLDKLIDAVNMPDSGCSLMIVGNGPDRQNLLNRAAECKNAEIVIVPGVPYKKLGSVLSCFDAGYLYYPTDTPNNLYCAPNKIYEYAGAGLPIIANDNPTVREELEKYSIGICGDDIPEAIKTVRNNSKEIVLGMRQFVCENTLEKEVDKLRAAISALFSGSRRN